MTKKIKHHKRTTKKTHHENPPTKKNKAKQTGHSGNRPSLPGDGPTPPCTPGRSNTIALVPSMLSPAWFSKKRLTFFGLVFFSRGLERRSRGFEKGGWGIGFLGSHLFSTNIHQGIESSWQTTVQFLQHPCLLR